MRFWLRLSAIFLGVSLLAACRNDQPGSSPTEGAPIAGTPFEDLASAVQESPVAPPDTVIPPTPTVTAPLAATVNGQPIYQDVLDNEVARRNSGLQGYFDQDLSTEEVERVILDMLIEQELIAQAAAANGIEVTEAMVASEMAELRRLADEAGGEGGYETWLQANSWTEAELETAVRRQILTENVLAFVTEDVPASVPQAHARYLQVDDAALAQSLWEQIRGGADFSLLAQQHSLDRATAEDGGDLGYFPAGLLLVQEVEAAAFNLQPGETSEVIAVTDAQSGVTTYYLVMLIEMDPARPISADLRAALLQERFENWLAEQRANADIVPLGDDGT